MPRAGFAVTSGPAGKSANRRDQRPSQSGKTGPNVQQRYVDELAGAHPRRGKKNLRVLRSRTAEVTASKTLGSTMDSAAVPLKRTLSIRCFSREGITWLRVTSARLDASATSTPEDFTL